jgi:acylphosphatase
MTNSVAARFFVSGHVQGVCFRASTQAEGERLGLRGHVRNLPDGRVEVLAAGAADAVDILGRWLMHGPPAAKVERVSRHEAMLDASPGRFEIRR